jgi:hypothetical protein
LHLHILCSRGSALKYIYTVCTNFAVYCIILISETLSEYFSTSLRICRDADKNIHRKMRLIEGNAKCCHLKKLTGKWTLRQVLTVWGPGPYTPPQTHTHTVYLFTVYLFTQERGEGWETVEPERRLDGQQFTKLVENTNMTDCISSL